MFLNFNGNILNDKIDKKTKRLLVFFKNDSVQSFLTPWQAMIVVTVPLFTLKTRLELFSNESYFEKKTFVRVILGNERSYKSLYSLISYTELMLIHLEALESNHQRLWNEMIVHNWWSIAFVPQLFLFFYFNLISLISKYVMTIMMSC